MPIPILDTVGTYFEVGFQTGKHFRAEIQGYHSENEELKHLVLPYLETEEGSQAYTEYLEISNKAFPEYVQEMEGMAKGADIPFKNLFALHLANEFLSLKDGNPTYPEGCTDIIINYPGVIAIGHTEDSSPLAENRCYIVNAKIYAEDNKVDHVEKFTAFVAPGHLPGHACGFNDSGLVFSYNSVYPRVAARRKIPRVFTLRALFRAKSINEVFNILQDDGYGTSYGVSVNAAHKVPLVETPVAWNFEISIAHGENKSLVSGLAITQPGSTFARKGVEVAEGSYWHCNIYKRFILEQNEQNVHYVSSIFRHDYLEKHTEPQTIQDIRNILGDESNKEHPFFRKDRSTDHSITVATAIFDLKRDVMEVYVGNPKEDKNLSVAFSIPSGKVF